MAYTLESLIMILQKILNPDEERWGFDHVKPQLESLREIATSLQKILETSVLESGPKMERIERQIQDAAHEAEDIIESHMVNQMIPGSASFTIYPPDLEQVTQQLHSVMGFLMKIIDGNQILTNTPSSAAASAAAPRSKSAMVGVEKDLMQLKDRLTGMQSKLEIVPIIGMGGIGKTTLARNLYQDSLIVEHFQYARAWTTISQDYNMSTILPEVLRCILGKEFDQHIGKENGELKDILYKSLFGRRYMIVLDDIWSSKFWDEMRRYFPDNNNGSRIVLTTRESGVAKHVDSLSLQHRVQLLSETVSWNLLRQIVFGEAEEDCTDELQGIGEKIARDCGGLPLAISVIGGLLSKVERSQDVWERIASDVRAAIANADEQFSNILSLSYNHLPYHLKPCFLYMAAFPEDQNIRTSRLTRLWVAEGFVKAKGEKTLEEEAEGYINALVERNLLMVRGMEPKWKTKSYGIHDLMRDLCIRKAEEEKFLHRAIVPKGPFHSPRRFSASSPLVDVGDDLVLSLTRSLICNNNYAFLEDVTSFSPVSRLVRVLDMWNGGQESDEFPTQILQLVNLRYLCIRCVLELPFYEISRALWNLQTLIIVPPHYRGPGGIFDYEPEITNHNIVEIPAEVWELPELRCIKIYRGVIRYGGYRELRTTLVRGKMQKISTIQLHRLNDSCFLTTFPNIRSLKLDSFCTYLHDEDVVNLEHLQKLEKLRCSSHRPFTNNFPSCLRLPSSLRKLTMDQCAVPAEFMASLCRLPNLQILRIGNRCHFTNKDNRIAKEWEVEAGDEFHSLQLLHLECLNLTRWTADETNFPKLSHLLLSDFYKLLEIPAGIGEIPTLELIELINCNDSVVESARKIVEEQQSEYENYDLQLRIN